MKKTKIICSIGPASNKADVMEQMVLAGMNVARINFSHATMEERQMAQDSAREVRKRTGKNVAILWDTKGPEFRSGVLEGESINLVEGKTIRIVKDNVVGNEERITVNHPNVIDDLVVGDVVLLENAKMKVEVISKENDGVTCKIINGGKLGNRKSLSVPGKKLDIPSYIVKVGEEISVRESSKNLAIIKSSLESMTTTVAYVEVDKEKEAGKLVRLPERNEMTREIDESQIVEFYNRKL